MCLNFFKKRKEKLLAIIEAKKALKEKEFQIIKEDFKILSARAYQEYRKDDDYEDKKTSEKNGKCPVCGSTNVNDRIKRIQGDFKGKGDIDGISVFGTGLLSGSYRSSGSIDTNEVNKCNDCQNEWKKYKADVTYPHKFIESHFGSLVDLLEWYHLSKTAKLDKDRLNEEFKTDEEKRQSYKELAFDSWRARSVKEFFKDIHIESISEIAEKEVWKFGGYKFDELKQYWNEEFLLKIGFKKIEL